MRISFILLLFFVVTLFTPTLVAQTSNHDSNKIRGDRKRFAVGVSTAAEELRNPFYRFPQLVRINSRVSVRYTPVHNHNLILSVNPFQESFTTFFPSDNGPLAAKTRHLDFSVAYLYSIEFDARDWEMLVGGQLESLLITFNADGFENDEELPLGASAWVWSFDALVGVRYTLPTLPFEIDLRGGPSLQERLRTSGAKQRSFRIASPRLGLRYTFGERL